MPVKKFIIIILSLLLALSLVTGCHNQSESTIPSESKSPPEESVTADPSPTPQIERISSSLNKHHFGAEFYSPVLGLCEDYPKGTQVSSIEKDFSMMAAYGLKDMRVSIAWGDYEPRKGFSDWTLLDQKVALASEYGITLYPYICYSPGWATGGGWRNPPLDYDDWYDFVYMVVDRYKDSIKYWELWNEGDNADFWLGTWQQQLELVKVGAIAVKNANPDAVTIFGGLTNKTPGHVNTIYTSGVAEYIDVINIHFYNETWENSPTENIYGVTKLVADVIRRYGGKQELWIAEIGYSDYVQEDGSISDWVRINAPYEKTQNFQAVTFIRAYSRIVATEDVSVILWYEIKNLRLDSVAIGDVNNYFLGALDHNYFPKPLWFAIAFTDKLFESPFKSIDELVNVEKEDNAKPYYHAFLRENGDVILLAWNRGTVDENIEITVPGDFSHAISYSVTGEKKETGFTQTSTGAHFDLKLIPEQMHIIELFNDKPDIRLNIYNPQIISNGNGKYTVSANIANIGFQKSEEVYAGIYVNPGLNEVEKKTIEIESLNSGQYTTVSWEIEKSDVSEPARLWISVKDNMTPPAAVQIEIP